MLERCGCDHSRRLEAALEAIGLDNPPTAEECWRVATEALRDIEGGADAYARMSPETGGFAPGVVPERVVLGAPETHHECDGSCKVHRAGIHGE